MVSEGYIIFYVKEMIIHGYHNQPFCKRQKAILYRFLMVFLMVSRDMSYPKKRQTFCRELMFSKVFSIFSRHLPFCRCIGCGCKSLLKIIQNRNFSPDPTFPAMKALFLVLVFFTNSLSKVRDQLFHIPLGHPCKQPFSLFAFSFGHWLVSVGSLLQLFSESFHLHKDCQHIVGKKTYFLCCKVK